MRQFLITIIQTITTLSGIEFLILPFVFTQTGIFYPFIVIIICFLTLLSIYLYRKSQSKIGLYTINEISQRCGGDKIETMSRMFSILYHIISIGMNFTIISTTLERMIYVESNATIDEWWKSGSVLKAMIITLCIPILTLIPNNRIILNFCHYSSYLFPLFYITQILFSIFVISSKENQMEIIFGEDITNTFLLHHFFPSFCFLLTIFAPFKSKSNNPNVSISGLIIGYFLIAVIAIFYGVIIGYSVDLQQISLPYAFYILSLQKGSTLYIINFILNCFLLLLLFIQIIFSFNFILMDIENSMFTSWQPSMRRRFILTFFLLSVIGLLFAFFTEINVIVSFNGSISGCYFVLVFPAIIGYCLAEKKWIKVVSIILLICGIIIGALGFANAMITFSENLIDNVEL